MKGRRTSIVWLRRDLRLEDQTALLAACDDSDWVHLVFVRDPSSITPFEPGLKPHAAFFGALLALRKNVILLEGDARQEIPRVCRLLGAGDLYLNKDYEPSGRARDAEVSDSCAKLGVRTHAFKDHVLLEERELLNGQGDPYRVFTPFKNAWFKRLKKEGVPVGGHADREKLAREVPPELRNEAAWKSIEAIVEQGRREARGAIPETGAHAAKARLDAFVSDALSDYPKGRDFPAIRGTSRISMDLRSGALSPRQVWRAVHDAPGISKEARDTFLGELAWRDFFMMVGFNSPHVFEGPYKEKYAAIRWRKDSEGFAAWCEGRTGFPIVDAGMRELVQTGFMHNRVRMITAMFLCKDLLIDWREGERFFRTHLVDAELAVNNGNWQWCASTGCDAQPYFRIFNPWNQGAKFDREGEYIRRYVPELENVPSKLLHKESAKAPEGARGYPAPCLDHSDARTRCLMAYNRALKEIRRESP